MSEGKLVVAEIQERETVPPIVKKRKLGFPFLAGALLLVALAAIWMVRRSSLAQPIQSQANKTAELTVNVVHTQKALI